MSQTAFLQHLSNESRKSPVLHMCPYSKNFPKNASCGFSGNYNSLDEFRNSHILRTYHNSYFRMEAKQYIEKYSTYCIR